METLIALTIQGDIVYKNDTQRNFLRRFYKKFLNNCLSLNKSKLVFELNVLVSYL